MLNKSLASRQVVSNQDGIHHKLEEILIRHRDHPFVKPFAAHTLQAFNLLKEYLAQYPHSPVILDSCCGIGESTFYLSEKYPDHVVLGVDKSAVRLARGRRRFAGPPDNMLLVRADVFDLWRLIAEEGLIIDRHYVLYPNPWPRKQHLKRRIHGHPSFFDFIRIGTTITIRSNWKIYLKELQFAAQFTTKCRCELTRFDPSPPITPFERKYHNNGQDLYQLVIKKD